MFCFMLKLLTTFLLLFIYFWGNLYDPDGTVNLALVSIDFNVIKTETKMSVLAGTLPQDISSPSSRWRSSSLN